MKTMAQLALKENEKNALLELKGKLLRKFPDAEIILYGSKAKGNDEEFSDIDILILLDEDVDNKVREEVFSISYDIELEYDVVFGVLVESKYFWNSSLAKAMPIHWSIDKEGLPVG